MARLIDQIPAQMKVWENLMSSRREGRLAHALAFSGPEGSGKKKMAWAFAQALLCDKQDQAPCGECGPCKRVESESSESVWFVEPEKNIIKLEAATQILDFLSLQRLSRARVVIVDQANLLNAQTANALLKAIEEPPPESYFILTTPGTSQLLPTMRSRVQNIRFQPGLRQVDEESRFARDLALRFLESASRNNRSGLDEAQSEAKEKEVALSFAREMQQVLRDWTVSGSLGELPEIEPQKKTDLWKSAYQVELDLLSHVDRVLVFENFFYRARNTFG